MGYWGFYSARDIIVKFLCVRSNRIQLQRQQEVVVQEARTKKEVASTDNITNIECFAT